MNQEFPPSMQLLEKIFGFAVSRSIGAAAELCIADLLKDGPKSAEELAKQTDVHAGSLYRVLRACASASVFSEDNQKRFSLNTLAEPLLSDAPNSLRAYAQMMASDWHFQTYAELPYTARTGKPAFNKVFGTSVFNYFWTNQKAGKEFNEAMTSSNSFSIEAVLESYNFSTISKLVEVGGGQGLLLASILKRYPHMQGILLDVPAVVDEAKEIIDSCGVADRCERAGGDFFEAVPAGGDAYIMKFILHDWDDEQCIAILKNCRNAILPEGKLLVVEMVLPEGNEPSIGKLLDLDMLLFALGRERTEDEYRILYDKAGFKLSRILPTMSPFSIVEGVCK